MYYDQRNDFEKRNQKNCWNQRFCCNFPPEIFWDDDDNWNQFDCNSKQNFGMNNRFDENTYGRNQSRYDYEQCENCSRNGRENKFDRYDRFDDKFGKNDKKCNCDCHKDDEKKCPKKRCCCGFFKIFHC